jgi:hypothetical protein
VKTKDSMGKTNFILCIMPFSTWEILAMGLHIGAPSKNIRKMNSQPILNKNSPWAHVQSKFDVLGIARKYVK